MDVLFINATPILELRCEANGTMLLATKLLQAGFQADILRFAQLKTPSSEHEKFVAEITDRILEISPKCVSFYALWPTYHVMLRIAAEVKARNAGIITVLGGPQASATAEATMAAMPFIDYICTGEGENTVVPFFTALLRENGKNLISIPGLCYRENGEVRMNRELAPLTDLETLPQWDERLYGAYDPAKEPYIHHKAYFMPIDAGRGCPFSCTFCCSSYFWKRTYRLKSPQRIVADIQYYHDKFGITSFWFSHDAFTSDRKLVSAVCDHILEKGLQITWKCSARVDCLTEELIRKMKQAGLMEIEMGIETGSPRMQKLINKRLDLEKSKEIIHCLLKNKIHVSLFFMYGFPEETEQDLNDTLEYLFSMLDAGVQKVDLFFCRFNPTTDITNRYMDRLVYDPEIKPLHRTVDAVDAELPMIQKHRELFPFFYHLNTPVRNSYQYLPMLVNVYRKYPKSIRHLRKLYAGDNLRFYRDLCERNPGCFLGELTDAARNIREHSWEMLCRVLDGFREPYILRLKELMRFERDAQRIGGASEDLVIREEYGFSYPDLKLGRPIEGYSEGTTEILLKKVNGKTELKICNMR